MKTFKNKESWNCKECYKIQVLSFKKKSEKHNYMYLRITLLEMKITKLLNLKMKKYFFLFFP